MNDWKITFPATKLPVEGEFDKQNDTMVCNEMFSFTPPIGDTRQLGKPAFHWNGC